MPWLSLAYGVFCSVSHTSTALPDAPNTNHYTALARTLRFIRGTCDLGLTFTKSSIFTIGAYSNAAYASEPHPGAAGYCRSRSGGFANAKGAVVQAFSKTQAATAIGTFEAECMAVQLSVRRLLALRRIASFILGATLPRSNFFTDADGVVKHVQKRIVNGSTRHIRVSLGFLLDAVDSGEIIIHHVKTQDNPADALVSAEDKVRFMRNLRIMAGPPPIP